MTFSIPLLLLLLLLLFWVLMMDMLHNLLFGTSLVFLDQNTQDDFIGEVRLPVAALFSESGALKTLQLSQEGSDKVCSCLYSWSCSGGDISDSEGEVCISKKAQGKRLLQMNDSVLMVAVIPGMYGPRQEDFDDHLLLDVIQRHFIPSSPRGPRWSCSVILHMMHVVACACTCSLALKDTIVDACICPFRCIQSSIW